MKQLAFITYGHSEYDDGLWRLLGDSGIDPHEFESLDYFGLLPFFVLAGASVRTQAATEDGEVHVQQIVVELDETVSIEAFFSTLKPALADAYA